MGRLIPLVAIILLLGACGGNITWKRHVVDTKKSKEAYEKCLRENREDTSKCDGLRRAYEAEVESSRVIMEDPASESRYDR